MGDDARTLIAFLVVIGILFALVAAQRRAGRARTLRGTGTPFYDGGGDGGDSGAPPDVGHHHGWGDGGHHGGGHSGGMDGGGGHGGGDGGSGGDGGGGHG